ncbi:hypothetical protein HY612_03325 [Candidatus Roizmanbacteria bacterium]|nr:hypothetical protein [Candidatus Roizmanbacteria bacterium]
MVTPELLTYVKQARLMGLADQEITANLVKEGWNNIDIQLALGKLNAPKPTSAVSKGMQAMNSSPSYSMWDAFEHILLFISLYVLATSIALTLHFFVDKWIPGISPYSYKYNYTMGSGGLTLLRGYLASLIVSYPLYAFFFLRVSKRTEHFPIIRNIKARKSLIYFTLVVTFIIVLANVISLVYGFLNGNVTLNFLLHFLITVGVSGTLFGYYLNQVKEDKKINV